MRKVINVNALDNYMLSVEFDNGEKRIKDISPLLGKPVFAPLKDINLFKNAFILYGAVTWKDSQGNEIDICPDSLYSSSVPSDIKQDGENNADN